MKKILVTLVVLALCAPAMADVTIKAVDGGDGTFDVLMDVTGESVVRGIALKVVCTGNSLQDLSFAADTKLNTFIDYFSTYDFETNTEGVGETPDQEGHPYALLQAGGGPALGNGTETTFVICEGALDATENQGGIGAGTDILVATVNVGAGSVCITLEDVDRGGVVGDELGEAVIVDGTCCPLVVTDGPGDCVKDTASFYGTWVDFGKPACWCFQRNCRGDSNGLKSGYTPATYVWVNASDLAILAEAYNKIVADLKLVNVAGMPGICADNNRLKSGYTPTTYVWVNAADLGILATYYNKTVASVPVCDQTNYNFWTN